MRFRQLLLLLPVVLLGLGADQCSGEDDDSPRGDANADASSDAGACAPEECGPAPGMPNYLCDDGVTVAGPGDCVRNEAGLCGWEITSCPDDGACTPEECGPAPGMPNYLCDDGVTVAGPGDCARNDDGVCAWEIVTCPE